MVEKNKEESSHSGAKKHIAKMKENPWMISTVVVGVVAIVLLVLLLVSGSGAVSSKKAGNNLISFAKEQGADLTIVSSKREGSVYNMVIEVNGQKTNALVTADGKYYIPQPVPLTTTSTDNSQPAQQKEVPKSDKPVAEAFVFSYCPYGLQFEKALIPVYNALKSVADFKIVFIGAMHGPHEEKESLRQICIDKNYGKDVLFNYLSKFDTNSTIGSCNGQDSCLNPLLNGVYSSLGIDANKINTCMTNDAPAIYKANQDRASSLGIGGSPTFVVNGVEVSVDRTPAVIQTSICSAFNNAPAACNQNLSTQAASAGFGASSGTSTGASC